MTDSTQVQLEQENNSGSLSAQEKFMLGLRKSELGENSTTLKFHEHIYDSDVSPVIKRSVKAVDQILVDMVEERVVKVRADVYRNELLPRLLSLDAELWNEGVELYKRVAGGEYFPIDVVDLEGNVIVRSPPIQQNMPSLNGLDFTTFMGKFDEASVFDYNYGGHRARNVCQEFLESKQDKFFSIQPLIEWDRAITIFGYPSYFTVEERNKLGLPPIELYPGCVSIDLGYSLVENGVSATYETTNPEANKNKLLSGDNPTNDTNCLDSDLDEWEDYEDV